MSWSRVPAHEMRHQPKHLYEKCDGRDGVKKGGGGKEEEEVVEGTRRRLGIAHGAAQESDERSSR
jgi:hypothetical protein